MSWKAITGLSLLREASEKNNVLINGTLVLQFYLSPYTHGM